MALGIVEPGAGAQPPGTEYLVDTARTGGEDEYAHAQFKHGKGKVGFREKVLGLRGLTGSSRKEISCWCRSRLRIRMIRS
jgi:hypothetical protein